ncbi:MAG: pyruvate ferredoxin oxidoreductase [Prevotella sp.]
MDYKYIEQLLERYWNCETSLEEEQILRSFFSQKDVPSELLQYRNLFTYINDDMNTNVLGDDFDNRIFELINEPAPVKAKVISFRKRCIPLFKAAAVVALFLALSNVSQFVFTNDNTYNATNASTMQRADEGLSVAMNDSLKGDTMKCATATQNILK